MRRYPHMLIGAGAAVALVPMVSYPVPVVVVAAVGAFAALVPDVDLNWTNRHVPHPRPGAPCRLFEHRGPTHSIVAALLCGMAVAVALHGAPMIGAAVFAGYLSHLLADGISYMGVPYLWPISARRIRLLPYGRRLESGGWVDYPIALALATVLSCVGILG